MWLLAATAGLVVANNYYSQPLLGDMAREFSVGDPVATWISSVTQFGYALGLLLLLPLGDMMDRRKLISAMLALSCLALIFFAFAPSFPLLLVAGLLVGFTSIVPQTLPPIASQLAQKGQGTRAVGKVMAGLLLGIVLSRFLGGWVGEYLGWRSVYLAAAVAMVGLLLLLRMALPTMPKTFVGSYAGLLSSLWGLWRQHGALRQLSISAALQFGAFSLFWTTLGFHLHAMPGNYSASVTGSFALIGATGVIGALAVGRVADRFSPTAILLFSGSLMILAFVLFEAATASLLWMVPAVIVLDLGMQLNHVTSMASVLELDRSASSRLNTVYMVTRFAGGAVGTLIGGMSWNAGGWMLVCASGAVMCAIALAINIASRIARPATAG
jgi:predicted MFS family arabinose efflux permease